MFTFLGILTCIVGLFTVVYFGIWKLMVGGVVGAIQTTVASITNLTPIDSAVLAISIFKFLSAGIFIYIVGMIFYFIADFFFDK